MTYDEAISYLQLNHFYPAKKVLIGLNGKKVTGLVVDAMPIVMDDVVKRLKEVMGVGWEIWGDKNKMEIYLTNKKAL